MGELFVEDFTTDSASTWPNWTETILTDAAVDLSVSGGLGLEAITYAVDANLNVVIVRDLTGLSSFAAEDRFRATLKFKLTDPGTEHFQLRLYLGNNYQNYIVVEFEEFDSGLIQTWINGANLDDTDHWDLGYHYLELERLADGSTEARHWWGTAPRPALPGAVYAGPTDWPASSDVILQVENSHVLSDGSLTLTVDSLTIASGSYVDPPPPPTAPPEKQVLLYINHEEVGDRMEWEFSTEESLGGTGRASLIVQSRDHSWEPLEHWDVKAVIANGPLAGFVLYRGEIIRPPIELPVGATVWKWKIDCADYNNELDWRLVGALDGKTWLDTSGLGVFVNIDPHASSLKTDKLTVQSLLDNYIRVDGEAFGTSTFVNQYLSDFLTLVWNYGTLRRSLEEMAAYVLGNLQFWADPDLEFHWVTIPKWQDLAQDLVTQSLDATASLSALMFAEGAAAGLVFAPFNISDNYLEVGAVGARGLKIDPDGSDMPQQVYVRGGTGYVYNAPPIPAIDDTQTVVSVPVTGAEGTYQLSITENDTKLWHTDSTGYVSVTYEFAAIGGPWPVKFVHIAWNADRNKGGYFWKFLSGPHAGLLASDHTNTLAYYGGILVEFIPATSSGTPQIGTGGSGWVGESTQDPNKRQAYLQAPISTTKALRDSLGGQAVYRGQYPTLRGSVVVSHQNDEDKTPADGWRVGQLVKITDSRLPTRYNGKYFVIQQVRTKLLPFTPLREYTLDFGDGPTSRYSYKNSKPFDAGWPPPANAIFVNAYDLSPGPNSTQTITAQLVNGSGQPWNIPGKVVEWSFSCYNSAGILESEGTISPTVSITDRNGTARTKLTTGADVNLVYYVFARVRAV